MPPLVIVALGALGAAALAKVVASKLAGASGTVGEAWRERERMARQRAGNGDEMETIPLVRDPVTGDYRPRQH